jgi:predicted methyltransferase
MIVDRVARSNRSFFAAPGPLVRRRLAPPGGMPALLAILATLLPAACPARPQGPAAPAGADINRDFLDPDLDPEAWRQRFEVESREVFACREAIVAALGLAPGDRVADVGSGTGLFLAPFAEKVGADGRVYAVDISPRLVDFLERRVRDEALANVAVVLSEADSTRLPPASVGHAFVCDTYHHFVDHEAMLASIHQALRPGGQLVVVDFDRIPGTSRQWLLDHVRAGKETVRGEIEAAGFEFVGEVEVGGFAENYLLRFRKH